MNADPWWKRCLRSAYYAALEVTSLAGGVPVRFGDEVFRLAPRWHRVFPPAYEAAGLATVAGLLRPGDTAVDVGAHVGVYTLAMGHAVGPTGSVLAFEPNPPATQALRRHVSLNRMQAWVKVYQAAVGAASGSSVLHTQVDTAAPGSSLYPQAGSPHRVEVKVVRLDDVFHDRASPRLIKLDVEGYERLVLLGGRELLKRASDLIILCEVHVDNMPMLQETPDQLYSLLVDLGYASYTLGGTPVSSFPASGQYLFRRPAE